MNIIGIIPARYHSSRLEGKPLLDIGGKPMVQRVYERALQAVDDIYVATDHPDIVNAVLGFGGKVIETSSEHSNGTSRCLEALEKITQKTQKQYNVVLNIQGDEPLLMPEQLTALIKTFNPNTEMATLAIAVTNNKDLNNPSECFVVMDKNNRALYFSRAVIPHLRGVPKEQWLKHHTFYKHLGLYAYTPNTLKAFSSMSFSSLEKSESLEQNRWLENGGNISVGITTHDSIPVDTHSDLERVRAMMRN